MSVRAEFGAAPLVPKVCGADIELANFIRGRESRGWGGTCDAASRLLLREIDGISGRSHGRHHSQDWGRKFLPANGGCAYIDLHHLELCIPECLGADDHVASWHAMLRIANDARRDAERQLFAGERLVVIANNSDGLGHSYGSHLSFLMSRPAWNRLFHRRLQELGFLASFFTSSIVFTGAGKVGGENGRAFVPFQLSQRADFFECVSAEQTTYFRPIVNTRDESHAHDHLARLHVIFFDNVLCHTAAYLRVGATQLILALIEAGEIDRRGMVLEDPVAAIRVYSADPTLSATAPTCDGDRVTAVGLQRRFWERAAAFVQSGRATGVVPGAEEIVAVWDRILTGLERR
ncbi:MAG: proteasome accessory factor PafA2 family protein, partial [Planctomycetes bacterium]|nr:proteasome accessory factor PafA2 family protein [Planctomycetota bacterium]